MTDDGTTIDGQTQTVFSGDTNPFGPEIVLDGSAAGAGANGLTITSNNNQVFGLDVQNFSVSGISIRGGESNWIAGNYWGTDATGTQARGNGFFGVDVRNGAQSNIIGTNGDGNNDAAEGNLISANGLRGIEMPNVGTNFNVVAGNFIGTDRTGTTALGNGSSGIAIGFGAQFNRVGTNGDGVADEAERNIISGNAAGVEIVNNNDLGTGHNIVAGNFIGTDVTGMTALGNAGSGILIRLGSSFNQIGTNANGIADGAERNVISGNNLGITVTDVGSDYNTVAGNYIGTDATGTLAMGNGEHGILIESGASHNLVGTNGDSVGDAAERNVISANGVDGVQIEGAGTDNNTIAGNFIGTDRTGTVALGNAHDGALVKNGARGNRIGTNGDGVADAAERNIISGNNGDGVGIGRGGATGNTVAGNYIGTNVTGTVTLGNRLDGVRNL